MIRSNNWLRKVCDKLGTFGGRKLPLVRTRLNIELLEDRLVPSGTPPTAVADVFDVHQGQSLIADPLLNDTDLEDDPLTPTIVIPPVNGSAYFDANNKLVFTPNAGFVGFNTISYRVNDGTSDSNDATITIEVKNIVPTAPDDGVYSVHQGESITVDPLANDADGDRIGWNDDETL